MTIRKLEDWEKDLILDHVQEGIALGETDEQLAERRQELHELLGEDVSLQQIRAVSAWIKIRSQKMVAAAKVEPLGIQGSDTQNSVKSGAEHFNYDNERKERWRNKWAEFIESETTLDERERMKVLCLPGKMCLEIPAYLRLGFKPENITGVEGGDEEARVTFRRNANEYGIQSFEGKMEKFLETDTTRYDVVSLDFHGQLAAPAFKIARKILLARKALVLTNFMAKREQAEVQLTTVELQEMMRLTNDDFRKYGAHALTIGEEKGKETFNNKEFELARARTLMGLGYHSNFGCLRQENRLWAEQVDAFPIHPEMEKKYEECGKLYSEQDRRLMFKRESIEIALKFFLEIVGKALRQHGMPEGTANNMTFMLSALSLRGFFGTPFTKRMQSYRYISQSEKSASPFESDFAVLHTPLREYNEMRHTLAFILAGAASTMNAAIHNKPSGTLCMRNKDRLRLFADQRLSNSDFVSFEDEALGTSADLRVSKIFTDLKKYGDIYDGCVSEKIDKNELVVPREIIE